jgi:hypothetical protein
MSETPIQLGYALLLTSVAALFLATGTAHTNCKTRDCLDAQSDIKDMKDHPVPFQPRPVQTQPVQPQPSWETYQAQENLRKAQEGVERARRNLDRLLRMQIQERCQRLYDRGAMPDWLERNCGI